MNTFREDVERAVAFHGHLCSGQCSGVKMARLGLKLLGFDAEKDAKRLAVVVECRRCPADAIAVVTGCRLGRRTYLSKDMGKVAASFINLDTGIGVRIIRARHRHPQEGEDMIDFYENLPWQEMYDVENIKVSLGPEDLPGPPCSVVICEKCKEEVIDGKHVVKDGHILCLSCAQEPYYTVIS